MQIYGNGTIQFSSYKLSRFYVYVNKNYNYNLQLCFFFHFHVQRMQNQKLIVCIHYVLENMVVQKFPQFFYMTHKMTIIRYNFVNTLDTQMQAREQNNTNDSTAMSLRCNVPTCILSTFFFILRDYLQNQEIYTVKFSRNVFWCINGEITFFTSFF